MGAENFSPRGDLEAFGNRLAGLAARNRLWHKARKIDEQPILTTRLFHVVAAAVFASAVVL